MCEYCDCQEIATIRELTREHEMVINLLAEIKQAVADRDLGQAAAKCDTVAAILGPHTAVEELGLFTAMEAEFSEHLSGLEDEHRKIDTVFSGNAAAALADPAWPSRLNEAIELLHEHILKEQDGVFPAALTTLSTSQWEQAEAVRAKVGIYELGR